MTKEYNPLEHSVVQAFLKADACNRYEVPDYVEALIFGLRRELERCYWNWHQEQLEDRDDWQLDVGGGFEYRRYFWGECDCGAESPVHAKDCPFVADHYEWNNGRLEAISDPVATKEEIAAAKERGASSWELMSMCCSKLSFDPEREAAYEREHPHPPCTCGAEANWQERDYHFDTCSPQLPNLKFKEVRINWYKHMGRGMSVNVDWTEKQWRDWFDEAMKVIKLYDSCMQTGHHKFRDEDAGLEPFSTNDRVQCKDCKYCVAFGANALIWNRQGSTDVDDADDGEDSGDAHK